MSGTDVPMATKVMALTESLSQFQKKHFKAAFDNFLLAVNTQTQTISRGKLLFWRQNFVQKSRAKNFDEIGTFRLMKQPR